MNEPAHCSLPTDLLKTGGSCSAIPPLSPRCWTESCITVTSSNAARGVGEPKHSCRIRTRTKEGEHSLIAFTALCQSRRSDPEKQNGASDDTPLRSWHLSRRSGCLPAEPYPPLRPVA